jgi:vesicle transport protein SEC22
MPIETLYIARVTDGLILVASMEQQQSGADRMDAYKTQAKQLIKKLNPRSTAKMTIESGSYTFQYVYHT